MARQRKITIECTTLLILLGGRPIRGWCPQCSAEADMITLGNDREIASLVRLPLLEWLNSKEAHRSQAADGSTQICLTSLLRCFESAEAQRALRSIENQFDEIRRKP